VNELLSFNINTVDRCWQDRCYIAPEKIYFECRQSLPQYKLYLELIAKEALKTPWTYFATQHIDEDTLKRYELELQNARKAAQAMKIYLTNLQKTGLAVKQGTEVIARDGYNMTTNQLEELQNLVDDERDRSRRATNSEKDTSRLGRGRARGGSRTAARSTSTAQEAPPQPIQTNTESISQPNQPKTNHNRNRGGRIGNRGRSTIRESRTADANVQTPSCAGNDIHLCIHEL